MKFDFDKVVPREGTSCLKYDRRTEVFGCGDVIPMWVADMDFEIAPCISEAIKRRAEHGVYGYEFRGDRYHRAITDWVLKRNGWQLDPDWIEFTPGVVSGLVISIRAFTNEGDGVVIQPPVYPPFAHTVVSNNRKLLNNPLKCTDDGFEIDFDDLDKKLAEAKLFILCSPHNPVGKVFTREELEKMAELCKKHDVVLVSDEIHSDLVRKPHKHIHIASLSDDAASRTITFMAPSKTFNIAGLSTSFAVIPGDKIHDIFMEELDRAQISTGNSYGHIALQAAYEGGEEWLEQLNEYIEGNVSYLKSFVSENLPGVKVYNCGGTYLAWLDLSAWGMDSGELNKFLINEAGIGLNSGLAFGEEGRRCARINLGTPREIVKKAMGQLLDACKKKGLA